MSLATCSSIQLASDLRQSDPTLCDGVEQGDWDDPDFLKESEEQGVTIDVKDRDRKVIELKLIRVKNAAAT